MHVTVYLSDATLELCLVSIYQEKCEVGCVMHASL